MFKHSRCLLALIGALGFTHSAVAENWRIKYVDGTVRLANVNVFNFQGSRKNAVPDFTETSLRSGNFKFSMLQGLFTKAPPIQDVKGFRYENCKPATSPRSWSRCDAIVNTVNGESSTDVTSPWILFKRSDDDSKGLGDLTSFGGFFINSNGNVETFVINLGWQEASGYHTIPPRVIEAIDFLTDEEGVALGIPQDFDEAVKTYGSASAISAALKKEREEKEYAASKAKRDVEDAKQAQFASDRKNATRGTKDFCAGNTIDAAPNSPVASYSCQNYGNARFKELAEEGWIIVNTMTRAPNNGFQSGVVTDIVIEKVR